MRVLTSCCLWKGKIKTLHGLGYMCSVSTVKRKAPLRPPSREEGSKIPSFNLLTYFCHNCWALHYATSGLEESIIGNIQGPPRQPQPTKAVIRRKAATSKTSSSKLRPSSQIFPWPNCIHSFQVDRNLPKTSPWAKWKVPGKNDRDL